METAALPPCSRCQIGQPLEEPFCPECGRLSPSLVFPGLFGVELQDIPSKRIRDKVVQALGTWFPQIDALNADTLLSRRPSILINGIDEDSAQRLLDALRVFKAPGSPVRAAGSLPWGKRLFNPGLVASAAALLLASFGGLTFGLLMLLVAAAAPVLWALAAQRREVPLIANIPLAGLQAEEMQRLSTEYSRVVGKLPEEDTQALRSLTAEVFEILRHLKTGSIASVAAGEETGRLYKRVNDAIRTALQICNRIITDPEHEGEHPGKDLEDLREIVNRTGTWFRNLEDPEIRSTPQLADELDQLTESIDRIVEEVRTNRERPTSGRTLA